MATAAWADTRVTTSISVEPIVSPTDGLGLAVYVADVPFDGTDIYRTYSSVSAAQTDETAGEIDADTLAWVTAAFTASPRPSQVGVVQVDITGGQTYSEALTAARDGGLQFAIVTASTRTAATQTPIATWAAANDAIYLAQSSDADWITSGVPAGWSGATTNAATGVVYNPEDTDHTDGEWAGVISAIDPDVYCPSFNCLISGSTSYDLTDAESAFAIANNCNVLLPLTKGGTTRYLGNGPALSGEDLYVRLTVLWLQSRIKTRIMQRFAEYDAAGRKFPLNDVGIAIALAEANAVGRDGVEAEHFTRSSELPDGYEFSATADVSTKTISVVGACGILDDVETVAFTISLTRGT